VSLPAQLFRLVLAVKLEICWRTLLLLHFGQTIFPRSRSEMERVSENLRWQASQRYSYVGMVKPPETLVLPESLETFLHAEAWAGF